MADFDADVLVVGAGPVGLALGCELRRYGVSCRVIDLLDEPVIYSKAAVVHARTMEVLEAMGVADTIARQSQLIHGLSAYSGGKRVTHVAFGELESPFPHVYGISQHDTEAILAARLRELGGTVERGVKLEGFTQDDDGVTATLSGRSAGTARFRWIVGCDGSHSAVRHTLQIEFHGAPYEEKIVQADVRVDWPRGYEHDEMLTFLAPAGPVACFPFFRDGRYRVLRLFVGEPPAEEPRLEMFQQWLDEVSPGARVSDPAWMVSFRIHHRLAARFRVGRAFLCGDAGHIHSPVGGQGMNTGIQDAHNLAWKLALVTKGAAQPQLLDSYEAERRAVAQELLSGTDFATKAIERVATLRLPLAVGLRNGFMSLVTSLDFVQAQATRTISMLNRDYAKSPTIAEDRGSVWRADVVSTDAEHPSVAAWMAFGDGPGPGVRAPDVTLRGDTGVGPKRLFELFGRRHVLLLFSGAEETPSLRQLARDVQRRFGESVDAYIVIRQPQGSAELTLHDEKGTLHDRYGAKGPCLYVIRPDEYVGYRSQPPDSAKLMEYLGRVLVPVTAK